MSKTHLQLSKETVLGIVLFSCVVVLFFLNGFYVVRSLIDVYGAKSTPQPSLGIDDTILSQAVDVLNTFNSDEN